MRSEPLNDNIASFYFKPPHKVEFTAGQFTEIYLPHNNPDKRGQKRWFTISSSPDEEHLAITTKRTSSNGSTFKDTLWRLKPGSPVDLAQPMGDFVLPKDRAIPLVFVAGGIGITPYRSMLKWLEYTKEERDIELLWAISEPKDAIFMDLLNRSVVVIKQYEKSEGKRLEIAEILSRAHSHKNTRIYISGPEPMVETLTVGLEKAGVAKNALVSDYFPGYPPI